MAKGIYIGTSGWNYGDWKGAFYPDWWKPAEYLSYYAQFFDTGEINSSFYHLPRRTTVQSWIDKVPDDFLFCPKISRYITHILRLKNVQHSMELTYYMFEPMRKNLGPFLIQLPPSLKFNEEISESFFQTLLPKYEFVLEVRHASWLEDRSLDLMKRFNVGFVISHSDNLFPYAEIITSNNVYIRYHGPERLYGSSYSEEMLQQLAEKIRRWKKKKNRVWVFFNNTMYSYGLYNALRLKEIVAVS